MIKNQRLVTVFNTDDQVKVAVLKTVLDDQGIKYVVKGELLYRNRSFQILVDQEDEHRVLEILRKFEEKERTSP